MSALVSKSLPDLSKLEPLDGLNYKRWSQKILIFFEQLDLDYIVLSDPPTDPNGPAISLIIQQYDTQSAKHEKDNKTVRGHLLKPSVQSNTAPMILLHGFDRGKKLPLITKTTVEFIIPEDMLGSVCGEDGCNLARLRQELVELHFILYVLGRQDTKWRFGENMDLTTLNYGPSVQSIQNYLMANSKKEWPKLR